MIRIEQVVRLINGMYYEDHSAILKATPKMLQVCLERTTKRSSIDSILNNSMKNLCRPNRVYEHVYYTDNPTILRSAVMLQKSIDIALDTISSRYPTKDGYVRRVKRIQVSKSVIYVILKDYKIKNLRETNHENKTAEPGSGDTAVQSAGSGRSDPQTEHTGESDPIPRNSIQQPE